MLTPSVRRTFAPRGQTPIQYCWDRRDRISAISALTVSPKRERRGLYFHLLPDDENVHATDVVHFLQDLRQHIRKPLIIIWDRGNVHDKSKAVQKYLEKHPEIVTEKFPSYAPELNPDEQVWGYTKYARMANFSPTNSRHLRRRLRYELKRMRKRPQLLRSFIQHSKLPWDIGTDKYVPLNI